MPSQWTLLDRICFHLRKYSRNHKRCWSRFKMSYTCRVYQTTLKLILMNLIPFPQAKFVPISISRSKRFYMTTTVTPTRTPFGSSNIRVWWNLNSWTLSWTINFPLPITSSRCSIIKINNNSISKRLSSRKTIRRVSGSRRSLLRWKSR